MGRCSRLNCFASCEVSVSQGQVPDKDLLQWGLGLGQGRPLPLAWESRGQWASRVERVGLETEGA